MFSFHLISSIIIPMSFLEPYPVVCVAHVDHSGGRNSCEFLFSSQSFVLCSGDTKTHCCPATILSSGGKLLQLAVVESNDKQKILLFGLGNVSDPHSICLNTTCLTTSMCYIVCCISPWLCERTPRFNVHKSPSAQIEGSPVSLMKSALWLYLMYEL